MNKQTWIEKIRNFYEDGTGVTLAEVLENHTTDDVSVIQDAFKEIGLYIGFCMDITVDYWSKKEDKYQRGYLFSDTTDIDYEKWKIESYYHREKYYPDSKSDNEYIQHMLNIFKDERPARSGNTGLIGYRYVFNKLLDGHTYKGK